MRRLLGAVAGVVALAASLWLLVELSELVTLGSIGSVEMLLMLFPTSLAIGFALLVWLYW